MGHAAKKPDLAIERMRPGKVLRGTTRYTGNLVAFKQTQSHVAVVRKQVAKAPEVAKRHTAELPMRASGSAPKTPAKPSLDFERIQSSRHPSGQAAANSDLLNAKVSSPDTHSRKSTLALAIIGSLSAGAVLGSVWPVFNVDTGYEPVALTNTKPVAMTTSAVPGTEALSAPVEKPEIQTDIVRSPVADVQTIAMLSEEHATEVDWLLRQNDDLKAEVESLSRETLELNRELLGLELQVATLEAEATPATTVRTVYNFVNVPIGDAIPPTISDQYNNIADELPPESVDYPINVQYPAIEEYPVLPEEFYESEAELASEAQEPGEYEQYYAGNEPAFDPQTGHYTDQQYIADIYQFQAESQVAFDPDTGFYVNPNYATMNENFADDSQAPTDYPPISRDIGN